MEEELTVEELDMLLSAMSAWYSQFYVGGGWKEEGALENKLERIMRQRLLTPRGQAAVVKDNLVSA